VFVYYTRILEELLRRVRAEFWMTYGPVAGMHYRNTLTHREGVAHDELAELTDVRNTDGSTSPALTHGDWAVVAELLKGVLSEKGWI
jgi:hypothetical protein